MTPFTKMHGLGNDFVVLDARAAPLDLSPARARAIADRRGGIGCDQIITLAPGDAGAAVFMRIHNPDGSEAGACGNATRCVAALIFAETGRDTARVRTIAGDLPVRAREGGLIEVDMGPPQLGWRDIPLAEPMDTLHLALAAAGIADPAACSMGNPHATFFVETLAAVPVETLGPELELAAIFPERANIGFVQVLAADRLRLRVWERGAGLTPACGSGACAALVNAHRRGLAGREATLLLDGGELAIAWGADDHVRMAGPVATAFHGHIDLAALPA